MVGCDFALRLVGGVGREAHELENLVKSMVFRKFRGFSPRMGESKIQMKVKFGTDALTNLWVG